MALLKVSWTKAFIGTPTELPAGLTLVTVGVVESVTLPVVKLNVPGSVKGFPAISVICVVAETA